LLIKKQTNNDLKNLCVLNISTQDALIKDVVPNKGFSSEQTQNANERFHVKIMKLKHTVSTHVLDEFVGSCNHVVCAVMMSRCS